MTYQPGKIYARTPEERKDPFLAWHRPDRAFFAAGACHILAMMFVQLHAGEGFRMVHIRRKGKRMDDHVYATNGEWAFDFDGWTREAELIDEYTKTYQADDAEWEPEIITVPEKLSARQSYLVEANHLLPQDFPYLPWERAYHYIKQFSHEPPRRRK